MMRKGSQAGRQPGQAHNTVINGARAKEMGHTDRERRRRKEGRREKRGEKKDKKNYKLTDKTKEEKRHKRAGESMKRELGQDNGKEKDRTEVQ